MGIAPKCDCCGRELTEPGALVFSPPETVEKASEVKKYHLCVVCFIPIKACLEDPEPRQPLMVITLLRM